MSVNDLKIDIITEVNQLSDTSLLEKIRLLIFKETGKIYDNEPDWDIPVAEIRKDVSFEDLIQEQGYNKITFQEFISLDLEDEWTVSIDDLLSNSN